MHAVAVAGLSQQLEVHRVVHAHATGALDQRLDDHCRDRVVVFGQGLLHGGEHVARVFFPAHALGAQVAIRARHLDGVHQQRFVGLGEQRHVAHRHRRHGFTVVAVGQGDETLFVRLAAVEPVVKAHFQRDFDAGRAVIGVEAPGQAFRRHLHQTLGQLDHRLMTEAGQDHMFELVDLVLDALVDPRVGVSEHIDPPGADRIEVAFAFEVFQPHAFPALDRDQRQLFVIFHLGAGMPQHGEIALHPLIIQAHFHSPGGGPLPARTNNRASLCNACRGDNPLCRMSYFVQADRRCWRASEG
ncbi:hypothetical protein D3C71_1191580 [compost metagenome]